MKSIMRIEKKGKRLHVIWIIPTLNIVLMNVFEYIDCLRNPAGAGNWWIQFLLIIFELAFHGIHYALAIVIPVLIYKRKKEFSIKSCLLAVSAILMANVVMLILELMNAGLDSFPNYMLRPVCVSMAVVIIVSALILSKESYDKECR